VRPEVRVVGAGVIGLSCAVRLAEAGFPVEVLTSLEPAQTTSAVAGGLWLPYRAEPADKVAAWAARSFEEFLRMHRSGSPNVLLRDGVLLHHERPERPFWADLVDELSGLRELADPAPGYRFGYALRVPVIDTPRYLGELAGRLRDLGGRISAVRLDALPSDGIVVNAAGLGARDLAGDPSLYPVRGQVVVADNPGMTDWICDEDEVDGELTYVLPRRDDVVIGGTAQERDERREPDPGEAEAILQRARALVPALAGARVRVHRVGLRPARPAVRLEAEHDADRLIVHCYGHGGSGVTLSWGCAADVLSSVLDAVQDGPTSRSARSAGA
jgi:D-amino-acid oxidase